MVACVDEGRESLNNGTTLHCMGFTAFRLDSRPTTTLYLIP
jgi:hypothetical protein